VIGVTGSFDTPGQGRPVRRAFRLAAALAAILTGSLMAA
jgi:hypothetical protein